MLFSSLLIYFISEMIAKHWLKYVMIVLIIQRHLVVTTSATNIQCQVCVALLLYKRSHFPHCCSWVKFHDFLHLATVLYKNKKRNMDGWAKYSMYIFIYVCNSQSGEFSLFNWVGFLNTNTNSITFCLLSFV